jgi:hypothetical protein
LEIQLSLLESTSQGLGCEEDGVSGEGTLSNVLPSPPHSIDITIVNEGEMSEDCSRFLGSSMESLEMV